MVCVVGLLLSCHHSLCALSVSKELLCFITCMWGGIILQEVTGEWEKLWSSCALWNMLWDEDLESDIFTFLPFPFFDVDSEQKWPWSFYVSKDAEQIWNKRRKASQCFKCICGSVEWKPSLANSWFDHQCCNAQSFPIAPGLELQKVLKYILLTTTLPFPCRFHDFKENIGNMTSVYPQDWGGGRQWV